MNWLVNVTEYLLNKKVFWHMLAIFFRGHYGKNVFLSSSSDIITMAFFSCEHGNRALHMR